MNKLCGFATITLSLVCLAGCKTAGDGAGKSANSVTPESLSQIADRQWILRMMIIDGTEYGLTGERPFVKFSGDGKVSGFASINRFSGSMQWDDQGKIQWSPLLSTRMAGPPESMNQEGTFLKALPRVRCLSLDGIHLRAQGEDKQVELVFYVPVK
jgi:heat shock protein HslJ